MGVKKKEAPQVWQEARWTYQSPLGPMIMIGREGILTDLYFQGEEGPCDLGLIPLVHLPVFRVTEAWLDGYFGGRSTDSLQAPPYELHGTDFQKAVWAYIETIPYGQALTYGAIAKALAKDLGRPKMSAQAVGGATGANPISLIVPCHRVMGAKGAITGYGGGLDRKAFLLKLEKIQYST